MRCSIQEDLPLLRAARIQGLANLTRKSQAMDRWVPLLMAC